MNMDMDKNLDINPFAQYLMSFVKLRQKELELLNELFETKHYKQGEMILKENVVCKHIVFILSGLARSYYINNEGKEYTWYFHFNDADSKFENYYLIDYNSFLSQNPAQFNIEAIENCEVVMLSFENIQKLIEISPSFEKILGKMSSLAYQTVHKRTFILLTLDAQSRYQKLLAEEPYLLNKFQHYLIASYIGVAPQTLSRLKNHFFRISAISSHK
jgi:CRP-like cAMP-binding protein